MTINRLITVEEHITYDDIAAQARALGSEPPRHPDPAFVAFMQDFTTSMPGYEALAGARIEHMDAVGVDMQVISHGHGSPAQLDHPQAVALCREVNDRVAGEVAQAPTRFAGFATLPLTDPEAAADELSRCVNELGFNGALIAGTYHGQFLDHARFRPLLRRFAELDVPLYIHPFPVIEDVNRAYYAGSWDSITQYLFSASGFGWHVEAGIHVLRLIIGGVLDEIPGLKLISGHWGETVPGYLERLDDQMAPGLHRERSISQTYRDQVWVTPSGIYTDAQLQLCLAQLGADHILWSEDYPYLQLDNPRSFLADAPIDDATRAKLAHENAEKLLRL